MATSVNNRNFSALADTTYYVRARQRVSRTRVGYAASSWSNTAAVYVRIRSPFPTGVRGTFTRSGTLTGTFRLHGTMPAGFPKLRLQIYRGGAGGGQAAYNANVALLLRQPILETTEVTGSEQVLYRDTNAALGQVFYYRYQTDPGASSTHIRSWSTVQTFNTGFG